MRFFSFLVFSIAAWGQAGPQPTVVFVNGYQPDCTGATLAGTFGIADQVLAARGRTSLFFNNCTFAGRPTIEALGASFGAFIGGLSEVDVVAHSMGGLIVRSYLSGKRVEGGFAPPAEVKIRKAVFLATPHFGTPLGLLLGVDQQVMELTTGSRFLFDLATWNQGTDDLRGVDALAVIGSGGTGTTVQRNFDDGVLSLMSGSIGFAQTGRTRVLPLCHTTGFLATLVCGANPRGIADIQSPADDSMRIIASFLDGTAEWRSIGVAAEDNPFLRANGGLIVTARAADDQRRPVNTVTATPATGAAKTLPVTDRQVAYIDLLSPGPAVVDADGVKKTAGVTAGFVSAVTVKPGPFAVRVLPAASVVFPLTVAPGEIISIYGDSLAQARVEVNGETMPIFFANANQINTVMPENASGLQRLTVTDTTGSHGVNVLVEDAVPAIFTADGSGRGPAAAQRVGNVAVLYLTGLGTTVERDGLAYAKLQPTVTVGGRECVVAFAGRAPGFRGLDQINCTLPDGLPLGKADVTVRSGKRVSNVATVEIP